MVEPVVVMPDILSKKESVMDISRLEKKNGKHPKIAMLNHERVVRRKACCRFNFLFSSKLVSTKSIPIKTVTDADDKKLLFFSSLFLQSFPLSLSSNAGNQV